MWSHYGDKHKGICLGFKLNDAIPNAFIAMNVNYVEHIKPIKISVLDDGTEDLLPIAYWVFTKSEKWKYEQEVRFVNFQHHGFGQFDKGSLVEIYFGLSIQESEIKEIQQILSVKKYHRHRQYQMERIPLTFDLDRRELWTYFLRLKAARFNNFLLW